MRSLTASQVPQLKRRLEQLLIMTKGLLKSSGAVTHILVGNLKHKDLAGHVVSSQAYVESSSEEEDENENAEQEEDEDTAPSNNQLHALFFLFACRTGQAAALQ